MSAQVLPEEKVPEERAGTLSQRCVSDAYNSCSPNMLNFENGAVLMSSRFLKSCCPQVQAGALEGLSWGEGELGFGFSMDLLSDSAESFHPPELCFFVYPSTSDYFCQALGVWNQVGQIVGERDLSR